jgi:hypothetical protein
MHRTRQVLLGIFLLVSFTACSFTTTAEPAPTYTPQPTYTIPPTYTPLPTYTIPPTFTPQPTYTIPVYYTVDITPTPSITPLPGVLVRIRNNTDGDVNLYRYGKSGELHFLGWLVPTYYGEFRFPSLGEWMIKYCRRDSQGNDISCDEKMIVVKKDSQEFSVP